MPKAIFFSVPGYGHILPSLPLVRALVGRGHHIRYFTTPGFSDVVAESGADVCLYNRVQDDYFSAHGLHSGVPGKVAVALLTTAVEALPELIEQAADADYVIYDCLCAWGYYAAHAVKAPAIVSCPLMPVSLRSLGDLRILRAFFPTILKAQADYRRASRIARELGGRYDVTPLDPSTFLNAPGDLEICYSSAEFVPHAEALPDTMRFVGWWMPEQESGRLFRREARPLIYLSLGTVNNENRSFFQMCIDAFRNTEYDLLISTGGHIDLDTFGPLPENITIEAWVPQKQVIAQAQLIITHGGLNSIHDALYCGVPLLIVPQSPEQVMNGLRVVDLGAGIMLKNKSVKQEAIFSIASRLLNDPTYCLAAQRIGESFRTAGGFDSVIDEIEAALT